MQLLASLLLSGMIASTIYVYESVLLQFSQNLFNSSEKCTKKIWDFNEHPSSYCLPPRSDHGYLDGYQWRAAGAVCWLMLNSTLPLETTFHPDLFNPAKGYRCDYP